jgi:alpha-L-arabinofuranosidase
MKRSSVDFADTEAKTIPWKIHTLFALIVILLVWACAAAVGPLDQATGRLLGQATTNNLKEGVGKGQTNLIKFTIDAGRKIGAISPMIYGQMIEHAYWSVHLGLWAQLIDNGGFELDRDEKCFNVAQGWELVSTDTGNQFVGKLDDREPFNARFSQQIKISKFTRGEVRLSQKGLYVKRGTDYKGFVFLRGDNTESIHVALLSDTGQELASQDLGKVVGNTWRGFEFVLRSNAECTNAAFVLGLRGEGVLGVDQLQVNPSDTYQGHGTRADMMGLYKTLKPAFIRWPGGTYLIWHHWKSGIGPREMRPVGDGRRVIGQEGEWDPNTFGTDEYMQFCADVSAEPMVNVNIKDGLQNTLEWIEYCNGEMNTQWGSQRARNGHPEPYQVKYWVIDNEPTHRSSEKGFDANQYPRLAREWAAAMKKKDPRIKVLIMGETNLQSYIGSIPEFTTQVVQETAGVIDRLCIHCYYDEALLGMPYKLAEAIGGVKKLIDRSCGGRDVKVALTEWNPQCNTSMGTNMKQPDEMEKNLQAKDFGAGTVNQAIEGAQLFHMMERASAADVLDIATPCQLCVNVGRYKGTWLRSALVQINNHAAWTSPLYHVNALYSRLRQPYLIQTAVEDLPPAEASNKSGIRFPAVDVVATKGKSNRLIVIKVVNNASNQEYTLRFDIQSIKTIKSIKVTEIRADSPLAMNTASAPKAVVPKEGMISPDGTWFVYKLQPHTVAAMEATVE